MSHARNRVTCFVACGPLPAQMKRIYSLLPKNVVTKIRNVIEFDGGACDTHVLGAGRDAPPLYHPIYRSAPGSHPVQANIPSGPLDRVYDIKYFPRDVRRAPDAGALPIEASFTPEVRARILPPAKLALPSSPGTPNPAVARYDPSGLRSAMTATAAATDKALAAARGSHTPAPEWQRRPDSEAWLAAAAKANGIGVPGRPRMKRGSSWGYTHSQDW